MKSILLTISLIISSFTFSSAQNIDNPIAYFDYFNQQHGAIVQQNMNYLQVMVHSDDVKQLATTRLQLLQIINQIEEQLTQLPDYDKDAGMKAAMQNVLSIYKDLYQGAYLEIEALKPTAQNSFELMQSYIDSQSAAEKQLADASRHFLDAQKLFAKTNGIILMEAQQSTETEQLNKLNEYQRFLFLSSFRVSKLNAQFLEGMNGSDETTINTDLNNLIDACKEEITKVEKTGPFNDNIAYRDAVLRQARTIHTLAEKDYALLIKGAVNSNGLTAKEANQYNTVIMKINATLHPLMTEINNSLQNLLRNNVPKPAHRGAKEI
jgi:hypothetical protein